MIRQILNIHREKLNYLTIRSYHIILKRNFMNVEYLHAFLDAIKNDAAKSDKEIYRYQNSKYFMKRKILNAYIKEFLYFTR